MEASERRINNALVKALAHWQKNVETFPYKRGSDNKEAWLLDNCYREKCELCKLLTEVPRKTNIANCGLCPLNDEEDSGKCCVEWYSAVNAFIPFKHHIEAVRDRIKRECEKRGLLEANSEKS